MTEEWTIKPFWFEGNSAWGLVLTRADWERIEAAYARHPSTGHVDLMSAKRGPDKSVRIARVPNYGFRSEHRGPGALRQHFEGED